MKVHEVDVTPALPERIAWLGDSHGASDYWSGALRTALQKRFGNGGVGFVHLGYRGYRHDGVKLTVDGRWKMYPRGPSTVVATGGMMGSFRGRVPGIDAFAPDLIFVGLRRVHERLAGRPG